MLLLLFMIDTVAVERRMRHRRPPHTEFDRSKNKKIHSLLKSLISQFTSVYFQSSSYYDVVFFIYLALKNSTVGQEMSRCTTARIDRRDMHTAFVCLALAAEEAHGECQLVVFDKRELVENDQGASNKQNEEEKEKRETNAGRLSRATC